MTNRDGAQLVLGKSGQLTIVDPQGREREKYILPNGARLMVHDGQEVTKASLAERDPFNEPLQSEEDVIRFTDIIDGKTVQEKVDDVTRQASLTIMEYRTTNFRPSISICDDNGNVKKACTRGGGHLQPARGFHHHGQGRREHPGRRHHRPQAPRNLQDHDIGRPPARG